MSRKRLYGMIRARVVPAVHIGHRVRVSQDQLDEWIRAGGSAAARV
jgi:excisionase family DNA binding protein